MNTPIITDADLNELSPYTRNLFLKWRRYMYECVEFNMPDSKIHAWNHCERVLLFALRLGEKIFGDDEYSLEPLAHAAIFHDTRREDDYLDTGHGARAAVYYTNFCKQHSDIIHHDITSYLMRYHDLDDELGIQNIRENFCKNKKTALTQYAIFKDADALDRYRLGSFGLNPKFLRTNEAHSMTDYAENLVKRTVMPELLADIDAKVRRVLGK